MVKKKSGKELDKLENGLGNSKEFSFSEYFKQVWKFIWEDDSIWSWIVNIILAFVLIKFIVYPGLGLALSTSHPIVAVVSGSMEHDGNFEEWWQSSALCLSEKCTQEQWYALNSITKEQFKQFSFKNGFNKGDIIFLKGYKPEDINIGDVIVFQSSFKKEPIIHRVVKKWQDNGYVFETKGDHNFDKGVYDKNIKEKNIIGKALFKIPYLGWIKIGFVELLGLFSINVS